MFNYHVTIILVTGSLIWGNCSCVLHLAMNSHLSTSCAYMTRSVIHRERITCRTRRFICGKIKNKHRAGDLRRKKRVNGSRGIFDPSKSARETSRRPPFPYHHCLSPPIRCELCDRIFTSVSNVLEEYIIHLRDYSQPLLALRPYRLRHCSEFINSESGNRYFPLDNNFT